MTAKLSANDLTLIRGERCLFQRLSFALNAGELLLLEGANGSGKTSLIRALAGTLSLESGEILWNDTRVERQRQDYHASLAWLAHKTGLKSDLTLLENLEFERSLRPQSSLSIDEVCDRLGIGPLKRLAVRSLSAGQQRRGALARLLLADVPLWLMDEPFTNLDAAGRALVCDLATQHLAAGGLCVMAAHQDVSIDAPTTRVAL